MAASLRATAAGDWASKNRVPLFHTVRIKSAALQGKAKFSTPYRRSVKLQTLQDVTADRVGAVLFHRPAGAVGYLPGRVVLLDWQVK